MSADINAKRRRLGAGARLGRRLLAALATSAVLGSALTATQATRVDAQVAPSDNPPIEQACGLDLTLVLDASGSVQTANAVEDVRDSASALLEALAGTASTARVTQFASFTGELAPRTQIDDASLAVDGPLGEAVTGYYNPRPPQPSGSTIYSYTGGDPLSSGSYRQNNGQDQYTNWDASLGQAAEDTGELVVYVTDGDPTSFNFDQPDDPFTDADVAIQTNSGAADQVTLDRAVEASNGIKSSGSRVLAVGVGAALDNPDSVERLQQISGPQVVRGADLETVDDFNTVDVALVEEFDQLADFMSNLAFGLCSPSLTVRKLAQQPGSTDYAPAQGWPMTLNPTVDGGSFEWVLPQDAAGDSATVDTDENGFAQFQWDPEPPGSDSTITLDEELQAGYTAGRPDGDDFTCDARDETGTVRTVSGDFADPDEPSFDLDVGQEIVTCTVYNSFDYDPQIAIEKTNSPTVVRGDLDPPAEVTSEYAVTNPGNTPIVNPEVTDDQCGPVELVSGDTNGDGRLDTDETWIYSCTRSISTTLSTDPAGENIVNTAVVTGNGTDGTPVTDDAEDDVDVFTPAIELDKTANGADSATVVAGDDVTYDYVVTNTGNTPLSDVSLVDDTPPCEQPTLVANGNGDDILDVGESWTYQCVSPALEEGVVNTATTEGTPVDPGTDGPFPGDNPPVTDTDVVPVTVEHPGIALEKQADPDEVLLNEAGDPEPVTYTFTATNPGTDPLAGPGGEPGTDQAWITDSQCSSSPAYVEGDSDGDGLLDPGEAWVFTCDTTVTERTVNVARIDGTPTDADGSPIADPISAWGAAVVRTVQPGVSIDKTALVDPVLDPDAPAIEGPDVPDPRQAVYQYEVANTGDVPLSLEPAPSDDKCSPLSLDSGDADADGLLDPDEVWIYTCETTLEREDADTLPGDQSALVENTASVTGVPSFGGELIADKAVTANDSASVTVIEPSIELTKTASTDTVKNGNDVTYTIDVTNTGDTELTLTSLGDDKCAPLELTGGDTDGDGKLDGANTAAETWTFTCTRAVFVPESGETEDVNTASVTATGPLGNTYEAEDSATVTVITPAIHIEKAPSDFFVPAGTDITYTFEVTNVGESALAEDDVLDAVTLRDVANPPLPECREPVLVAKEGGNDDDLLEREPPEVWTYECTAPIDETTTDVAVVEARGGAGDITFRVADFDVVRVGAFHPGLEVTKTASPEEIEGSGEVTYTYEVVNTGDVPLANVAESITDDTCEPVELVSGDTDGDGLLDTPTSLFEDSLDETWVFTCTTTVDEDTVNTVVVDGTPSGPNGGPLCGPDAPSWASDEPCDVDSSDQAEVRVLPAPEPPTPEPPAPTPPEPAEPSAPEPERSGSTLPLTGMPAWLWWALVAGLGLVSVGLCLHLGRNRLANLKG